MNTIAELLAERKRLDARIKRAVAKAFPAGSRWEFRDRFRRTRVGEVVVQECRGEVVSVKWANERDNYDAKLMRGPATVGKSFSVEPQELTASAASPGAKRRGDGRFWRAAARARHRAHSRGSRPRERQRRRRHRRVSVR